MPQKSAYTHQDDHNQHMVASYLNVRLAIGILAGALPIFMLLIRWLYKTDMQESVSAFYHVLPARNWFVATLCCVSIFLVCYRGYSARPNVLFLRSISETTLHRVMGAAAFGVAMLPTKHPSCTIKCPSYWSQFDEIIAIFHLFCAFTLFAAMALVALFYFPVFQGKTKKLSQKMQAQNAHIYRYCGITIVAIGGVWVVLQIFNLHFIPLFWVELVCIIAFSVAWIAKSHFLRRLTKQLK